jgi:hypothetical protein
MQALRIIAGGFLLACMAAGCATPASRIRHNAELFAGFPPEIQDNIRKGKIEIGYTKPMVYLALGRPSRIYDRSFQGTNVEIWAYTDYRYSTDFQPTPLSYWYRDAHGRMLWAHDWTWLDMERPEEYETMRVEFYQDKVSAIERLRR